MRPVVVVGGGLSGLAAAVTLASAGRRVVVLEQRPFPGGRAYSFQDPRSNEILDNGQHLLIGAYTRTRAYLRTIGTSHLVSVQRTPEIRFFHPERGFHTVRLPPFPPPLHLAAAVFRTGLFDPGEKRALIRGGVDVLRRTGRRRRATAGWTVQEWLDRTRQPFECRRSFWEPLAVSIMNERGETASAGVFLDSLRQAFVVSRAGAAFVVPTVGLSELLVHNAVSFVRAHGGDVRCGQNVVEIPTRGGSVQGVMLDDGSAVQASSVILSVPPDRAVALLPPRARDNPRLQRLAGGAVSPIISVHLWYEHDPMPHDVTGVIGRTVQWLFNTGRITAAGSGRVTGVISAAAHLVTRSNEELAHTAAEDAAALYGEAARKPVRSLVIRERRATFSLTPENDQLRPGPGLPVSGLFLAGDWTATGLPATIEGAILSGERAAGLVLRENGG